MTKKYSIRRMKDEELSIALDWAKKEGWNPGINDSQCFFQADPQGFFLGMLNDEPIAAGSAVVYDDQFAFCGLYIVKPEYRNQGYGIQLTQERLKYVGNRITGLDGVLDKVSKYERIGYVSAHRNTRYELSSSKPIFSSSQYIVELQKIPFADVNKFDRKYFPAPRQPFLNSWINQSKSFALGYMENQKLLGYGVIRKCVQGYKIGPLFAETQNIAKELFDALCSKVTEGPIFLDIPEPNLHALALVKHYKMTPKFEVIRMYRNGIPSMDLQGIYGITTFELG